MHPFPISQPHVCVTFQKLDVTMPPALLPTPGKQNLRKRGQSWEGWTASPCHDWQQEVPHKSEVSRLIALSVQNTHSNTVPRRCLLSKPTANRPSEKHSSYCRVSTTVETGQSCPLWLMPLKWTHLAIKPCCSLLSPASGSLATVPENPNTPVCTVLGHIGWGSGRDCVFGKSGWPQSRWSLWSSPKPPPSPFLVLFLRITGCLVLPSSFYKWKNECLEKFSNFSKFTGLISGGRAGPNPGLLVLVQYRLAQTWVS